jgi:EAL domain-containing protein (putative c-di-GMP-specific phosphodiesterase class I)/CheY-like chemotaxis protein
MSAEPAPSAPIRAATAPPGIARRAAGETRTALAFVIDDELTIRQFISLILQGSGVDTMEFADGTAFRKARSARAPDLIFLNVNLDAQDAVQSVEALGKARYGGVVQLMSSRGSAVLENVKQVGEQLGMNMLPVLKKPFETATVQKILADLKLGFAPPAQVKVSLAEAIENNWVEFWYQPKIDLRKKQLAGAEAFARVRHPEHGILLPGNFMPGADEASLFALAEQALLSALKSGLNLSRLGVNLRMAVNVSVGALAKLPVGEIVRAHRPEVQNWAGLVLDVAEQQIINEITLAQELSKKFAEHNVRLAIDEFGKGYAALTKLKELPFAEMKLDRSIVTGSGTDKANAPMCKTLIDLAHNFGSLAVGIGLEKASDAVALVSMGCDLGQGFLFGQPMPEERFIALLKQRVTVRQAEDAADAAAAAAPARA